MTAHHGSLLSPLSPRIHLLGINQIIWRSTSDGHQGRPASHQDQAKWQDSDAWGKWGNQSPPD